ncbi:MAG: 4a-hydroxytetrahydrobiopterin dehydratase [bacterium]|nr:4a-hydroxytetrahydrobiopterin dehydratase [bacterium]
MTSELTKKRCVPCEGGMPPFTREEAERYLPEVPGWQLGADGRAIRREFAMKDFKDAMAFINKVAEVAEAENHHPDMELFEWNKLRFILSTHAIGGLSENDFILAAKINALIV